MTEPIESPPEQRPPRATELILDTLHSIDDKLDAALSRNGGNDDDAEDDTEDVRQSDGSPEATFVPADNLPTMHTTNNDGTGDGGDGVSGGIDNGEGSANVSTGHVRRGGFPHRKRNA